MLNHFRPSNDQINFSLQYWDYQLRVGYELNDRERVSLFAFGAYDNLSETHPSMPLFGMEFHRADVRWDSHNAKGDTLRVAITYENERSQTSSQSSTYTSDLSGTTTTTTTNLYFSEMNGVRVRVEGDARLSREVEMRAGTDLSIEHYLFHTPFENSTQDSGSVVVGSSVFWNLAQIFGERDDINLGMYVDFIAKPMARLEVVPGLRVDFYSQRATSVPTLEPRLAVRYQILPKLTAEMLLAVVSQWPTIPLTFSALRPALLDQGIQQAMQTAVGVKWDAPLGIKTGLTLFYNNYLKLNDIVISCTSDACGIAQNIPGRAYGLEVSVRRD